jgi:hypothetical protein
MTSVVHAERLMSCFSTLSTVLSTQPISFDFPISP